MAQGVVRMFQSGDRQLNYVRGSDLTDSSTGKVVKVYPDRMACDILSGSGGMMYNVPILSNCGLEELSEDGKGGEVWGELDLPSVNNYVMVQFFGGRNSFPYIDGSLYPYAHKMYQGDQKPVNSADKQFTLKLLEDVDPKTYRRIFKSGTSLEVQKDGTIIVETPDGSYIRMDATEKGFLIEDASGNIVTTGADGVKIEDCNGNDISMVSGKVTINGNLEISQ